MQLKIEKKKDATELKNTAESRIWEIEKNIDTYKNELTDAEKDQLREKIKAVRNAIDQNNHDAIKSSEEALSKYTNTVFEEAYKKKAGKSDSGSKPPGGDDSGSKSGGDVKDM